MIRPGPYTLTEATAAVKLAGPTIQINAGDGSMVLAASTQGSRAQRAEIEAACDLVLAALNDDAPGGDDGLRAALEKIASDDVTSAKAAKDVASRALAE